MGGACSGGITPEEKKELQLEMNPETTEVISKLNLFDEDVNILWHSFCKIDKHHNHLLSLDEFLKCYDLDNTFFARKVFSKMDSDGSRSISFPEFICSVWDFLTLDLEHFVFDLYDTDKSHKLSRAEFEEIALCAYGIPFGRNHELDKEINATDENHDGQLTFEEFQHFVKKNQNVGYPGFQMQLRLMDHIGGQGFWATMKEKRHNLFKKKSINIILQGS